MKVFVDMDGTIAKFYESNSCLEEMYNQGFFKYLSPYVKMLMAIKELIKRTDEQLKIYICSACITEICEQEKREWLKAFLPEIPEENYIFLPCGKSKAEEVKRRLDISDLSDCYLIDDYSVNLFDWESAGGHGLKFMNELNGTKGSWKGKSVHYQMEPRTIMDKIINLDEYTES